MDKNYRMPRRPMGGVKPTKRVVRMNETKLVEFVGKAAVKLLEAMATTEPNKRLVITNDIFTAFPDNDDEANYNEYVDYCEMNGQEPGSNDSQEYWEWKSEMTDLGFEDDIDNIASSSANDGYFAITGSIGRWNGPAEIQATVVHSLVDALKKIFYQNFDHRTSAYLENGHIAVRQSHHDGTNSFVIYKLNQAGIQAYEESEDSLDGIFELSEDMIEPIGDVY